MHTIHLHTIELTGKETYLETCISRIGGRPDLPIELNYPVKQDEFLEFLLQINLNHNPVDGLPKTGMLSLFNGNLDKREAWGFYFKNLDGFELKEIPVHTKFSGITSYSETVAHHFKISIKKAISLNEELISEELEDGRNETYYNNSYLNGPGLSDSSELYLQTNNLELISYAVRLNKDDKSISYSGRNGSKSYNSANDVLACDIDNFPTNIHYPKITTREEFNEQLKRFEERKEYHLQRYVDFTCILSLSSSLETEMIWGDHNKLELFGFKSEFERENFSTLYALIT